MLAPVSASADAINEVVLTPGAGCSAGQGWSLQNKNTGRIIVVTVKWDADVRVIDWLDAANNTTQDIFPKDYTIALSPGQTRPIGCTNLKYWPHTFSFGVAGAQYINAVPSPPIPLGDAKSFIRQFHNTWHCWAVNLNPDRAIEARSHPAAYPNNNSTSRLDSFHAKELNCPGGSAIVSSARFLDPPDSKKAKSASRSP
jgi:hypothetical protein